MWVCSVDFKAEHHLYRVHQVTSSDGLKWTEPSPVQIANAYAPCIIKEDGFYRMWFVDSSVMPWLIRYASSADGQTWQVAKKPVLGLNQDWEHHSLFYPTVLKVNEVYLMWYGAYWSTDYMKTALGLAVSLDGLLWHKNPHNPVFRPDPNHFWESHYTTSQSVLRFPDGTWRIWYASRKEPPHSNKYFAIGTARWSGP